MREVIRTQTRKVVQLVGEIDRERDRHPPQTFTKYRLYGADLGTPLDFGPNHPLWFLFGDAWTANEGGAPALLDESVAFDDPYNVWHPFNADPIGFAAPTVTAENLDSAFELDFFALPWPLKGYLTLEIPGVNLLTDKVPTGAINTPSGAYVFATGKPFPPLSKNDPQSSWVARWSDLTVPKTEQPYLFSSGRFANYLVPVIGGSGEETGTPGLPREGPVVWLWGTGFPNRMSSVRLAYVPLSQIGDRSAWRFYYKTNLGFPHWVSDEAQATPVIDCASVGEFSVAWNKYLGLWLMLHGSTDPRGIVCRWAEKPWGPWSNGIVVFDPWKDGGYGHFMHIANDPDDPNSPDDHLSDPGREGDWGGEYAPIFIPRYVKGTGTTTTIRYTMSTWNPYTVVIMESDLRLRSLLELLELRVPSRLKPYIAKLIQAGHTVAIVE